MRGDGFHRGTVGPGGRPAETGKSVFGCDTLCGVDGDLWWPAEQADYVRRRDQRYPGATSIEPDWCGEAAKDPRRVVRNPDPKSRTGAIRVIGYSPTAGFVVTVIVDPIDGAGITAWKTSGADLRDYEGGQH